MIDFKNRVILILVMVFLCVTCVLPVSAEDSTKNDIHEMVLQTMNSGKIPDVSAAIVNIEETEFFTYHQDELRSDGEDSLFYIGSVSKSFTGFAVLLLEERGQLSLDDTVTDYLPEFQAFYQGIDVAGEITLADLLYQTSGFTNDEKAFPNAEAGMTLADNIAFLSGRTLAFMPSEGFSYANANYNILGYIIEVVSGQSYDTFMMEQVFLPLGLTNTYASSTGLPTDVVPGYRIGFGRAWEYQVPVSEGAVPAGYIVSCSRDLGQWARVQLGLADVDPVYQSVVEKSHVPNPGSLIDEQTFYAAGWYVNEGEGRIYHSGGTPNYSSYVVLDTGNGLGACVLTNINASANTNDIGENLIRLQQGGMDMAYSKDIWTIMDLIFTIVTLLSIIGCGAAVFLKLKGKKAIKKVFLFLPAALFLLAGVMAIIFPLIFSSSWPVIFKWGPPSIVIGISCTAALAFVLSLFYFLTANKKTAVD